MLATTFFTMGNNKEKEDMYQFMYHKLKPNEKDCNLLAKEKSVQVGR